MPWVVMATVVTGKSCVQRKNHEISAFDAGCLLLESGKSEPTNHINLCESAQSCNESIRVSVRLVYRKYGLA